MLVGELLGLAAGERPVALLVANHGEEARGDGDPVEVVGDDGADGGRVLPAEDGVEDAPEAASVEVGVAALRILLGSGMLTVTIEEVRGTYVDVPNASADVVGAGAGAEFCCVTSDDFVPL